MVKALQIPLDNDFAEITVVQAFDRLLVGEPDSQWATFWTVPSEASERRG